MIISPLILSAVYEYNMEAVYYFSSVFPIIAGCIMGYVSTWKNARELGKASLEKKEEVKKEDVELQSVEVDKEKEDTKEKEVAEEKEIVTDENTSNTSQSAKEL